MMSFTGNPGGIFSGVSFAIHPGEILAVTGPNASGKSLLSLILAQEIPSSPFGRLEADDDLEGATALLQFSQQQTLALKNGFLAARWHSADIDSESVGEYLSFNSVFEINPFAVGQRLGKKRRDFAKRAKGIVPLLELAPMMKRPVLSLSNGEMRRILLARALLKSPRLLVLDDAMAGLDPAWRGKMKDLVVSLARSGTAIVLVARNSDEIPPGAQTLSLAGSPAKEPPPAKPVHKRPSLAKPRSPKCAVSIRNLTIRLGKRTLFKNFSWQAATGEKWLVRGPNGSGKTTLFSLITGDNPSAYACDIEVLGQRRKVGLPLGRIRNRIAMVSPEAQCYFPPEAIVNGRAFATLSSGEQLLALLDRALSAKVDLLLLDEPCMNLDDAAIENFFSRLSAIAAARPDLTIIATAHRSSHIPPFFDKTLQLLVP